MVILKPDSRERLCSSQVCSTNITNMKLFVGNLSFDTTENDLQDLFEQHGQVSDVALINDKMTGRSRGFAFVTMNDDTHANAAVSALNGHEFQGRALTINEARAREERPRQDRGGQRNGGGRQFAGGSRY